MCVGKHHASDILKFIVSPQTSVGGVISIELIHKRSLWGYLGDDLALFMRVTVTQPRNVPRVRDEWILVYLTLTFSLTFKCFYVSSKMEKLASEGCFPVLSRPLKAIFHIHCDS